VPVGASPEVAQAPNSATMAAKAMYLEIKKIFIIFTGLLNENILGEAPDSSSN